MKPEPDGTAVRHVVITTAFFEPGYLGGGPICSVANIVDTAPTNIDLLVITQDRDLGQKSAYPGLSGRLRPRGRSQIFYLRKKSPTQWFRLLRRLRRTHIDVLYLNSLWNPSFSLIPLMASRL